jgi:hypothetical protein
MDRVVPDSERISCEDLRVFLQSSPEVACCFKRCEKKYSEAIKTIASANKKLRVANNNLQVLK